MNIKIIGQDFDVKQFNSCAINPMQSWEWGEARKKMGIEVLRIGEFSTKDGVPSGRNQDILTNVFQITFHRIPYTKFVIGYLPRSVIPSEEVLDFLKEEAKKRNCIFIKIEPYIKKNQVTNSKLQTKLNSENLNVENSLEIGNWKLEIKRSSHPLFPKWTQTIDLTKSEEELLRNMHPKTRYNIRLAEKRGVTVKEMTNDEGFEIFQQLYFETCRRQSYRGHNETYHKIIFNTLKDTLSHILVAFYTVDGKTTPLACYQLLTFNDVCYYVYGGSTLEYKNVMAPNLLMWVAIQFGKKNGFSTFDMWGSLPPNYPQNDPWAGFTRFKEGYGSQFMEFIGSYDMVLNPMLYRLYNIVYAIRKRLL